MPDAAQTRDLEDYLSRPRLARLAEIYRERLPTAMNEHEPFAMLGIQLELAAATEEDVTEKMVEDKILLSFFEADPSHNGAATQWLMQTYIRGGFRFEDLDKARETLAWFGLYRAKMPVEARDLNRYTRLASLWRAVEPFVQSAAPPSKREEDRREREAARAESRILVERDDGLMMAVPLTRRASNWWGRGTRWCTAATKGDDQTFESYADRAPLVFVLMPDGEKLQLWCFGPNHEFQFMDDADDDVPPEYVREHWDTLGPLLLWYLEQEGSVLKYVPVEHQTYEMCLKAVQHNDDALISVRRDLIDDAMVDAALEESHWAIRWVPERFLTPERIERAIRMDGALLASIPQELITPELIRLGLTSRGKAIEHIAVEDRTSEDYRLAGMSERLYLKEHPPEELTEEILHHAISRDGRCLGQIPLEMRTFELCKLALSQNAAIYEYLPKALREEPELHRTALKTDIIGYNSWMDEDNEDIFQPSVNVWTQELALEVAEKNPNGLWAVPSEFVEGCHEHMARLKTERPAEAVQPEAEFPTPDRSGGYPECGLERIEQAYSDEALPGLAF